MCILFNLKTRVRNIMCCTGLFDGPGRGSVVLVRPGTGRTQAAGEKLADLRQRMFAGLDR